MHRGAARHVREERAFAEHGAGADQRHAHARFFVFVVNAQVPLSTKYSVRSSAPCSISTWPLFRAKRLHVAGQDVPVRLVELTTQCIAGVAMQDGLGEALDVKTDGGGEWSVHSATEDTFALQQPQGLLTPSYT
jgi:hypothetical protein